MLRALPKKAEKSYETGDALAQAHAHASSPRGPAHTHAARRHARTEERLGVGAHACADGHACTHARTHAARDRASTHATHTPGRAHARP